MDIYTGETTLFEFTEPFLKSPTTFDELERYVSIYNPSEVVIIGNVPFDTMDTILEYASVQCNSVHKVNIDPYTGCKTDMATRALNSEKQSYQKELLTRFFKVGDYDVFYQMFAQYTVATQAFCFLLDFIFQHNPNLLNKVKEPRIENRTDRLFLANHSLKQLNIIRDGSEINKSLGCVESMLNVCITAMGRRRFSYHLLNPTTSVDSLREQYQLTETFLENLDGFHFLSQGLSEIRDLTKIHRQIVMKKISPKTLLLLHQSLLSIRNIFRGIPAALLSQLQRLSAPLSSFSSSSLSFADVSVYCMELLHFLETRLDLELCFDVENTQQFDVNFIKRGVDSQLDEKTEAWVDAHDQLEAVRQYLNNMLGAEHIKIHETEKNQYALVATKRRCATLKQSLPVNVGHEVTLSYVSRLDGITRQMQFPMSQELFLFYSQSATNETISSTFIKSLCNTITAAKGVMKDMIAPVYTTHVLSKFEEEFLLRFEFITEFVTVVDYAYAKAVLAKKFNYCKPNIIVKRTVEETTTSSFVNARGLRHCLIEQIQKNEIYVTNDIEMASNGMLLYGTNAVGKTSLIRAIGVAVIMAQAGLHVPCTSFEFFPYKHLFTRILGNDDIHKGLSTFAVEMSELRTILRVADSSSLILGDELCSGTESVSAKSIFVAGLQMLAAKRATYLFATHLHEIKDYDEVVELMDGDKERCLSMKHMEVIYDKARDVLVYDRKLKDGPGESMYGLEVCKSLSLPQEFLERAHQIRRKYLSNEGAGGILSAKTSHFNRQKVVTMCEQCGLHMAKEVHHLYHQKDANEDGLIQSEDGSVFHKNHRANLLALCEKCHDAFHRGTNDEKRFRKKKTSAGVSHGSC
jgi:DNA mismatch repair protein MutS